MMSRRALRPALWLFAVPVLAGCSGRGERAPGRRGLVHAPSEWAISWRPENRLTLFRRDEWRGDDDFAEVQCEGTGVYALVDGGARRLLWSLESPCETAIIEDLDLSPDDRYLVYRSASRLHRLDLRNGSRLALTDSLISVAEFPSWSPDGQRLMFFARSRISRAGDDRGRLVLMSADGSDDRPLASVGHRLVEAAPTWSPDMRSVAFSLYPGDSAPYASRGEIVVLDTLGDGWHVIAEGYQPSWSPTGEWVAYLSVSVRSPRGHPDTLLSAIRLVRPDGSDDHLLYSSTDSTMWGRFRKRISGEPSGRFVWSPDGRRLAFSRRYSGQSMLWVIGVDGTQLRQMAPDDAPWRR